MLLCVLLLQVLFLGWPLFSKAPGFRRVRQLHRFAWLLTSIALLVWHAVVFEVLLQQPQQRWTGALNMAACSSHADVQVRSVNPASLRGEAKCCWFETVMEIQRLQPGIAGMRMVE
jgi:hypothetical protein